MCSPDFSPIEAAFSVLKRRVMRVLLNYRRASDRACQRALREALQELGPAELRGEWKFLYGVPTLPSKADEEELVAAVVMLMSAV